MSVTLVETTPSLPTTSTRVIERVRARHLKYPDANGFTRRSLAAFDSGTEPLAEMIKQLGKMSDVHHAGIVASEFDGSELLARDSYTGKAWLEIASACVDLLSSTAMGKLDGGFCDGVLRALAVNAGFDEGEV